MDDHSANKTYVVDESLRQPNVLVSNDDVDLSGNMSDSFNLDESIKVIKKKRQLISDDDEKELSFMTKSVVSSPAEEESLVTSKSDEESQSGVSESQESSSSTHDFVDEEGSEKGVYRIDSSESEAEEEDPANLLEHSAVSVPEIEKSGNITIRRKNTWFERSDNDTESKVIDLTVSNESISEVIDLTASNDQVFAENSVSEKQPSDVECIGVITNVSSDMTGGSAGNPLHVDGQESDEDNKENEEDDVQDVTPKSLTDAAASDVIEFSVEKKGPSIISPPSLNPEMYNRLVSGQPEKRLFGGKMTERRMEKVHAITGDVISAMHKSLSTVPEDVLTDAPAGLRIDLMGHQKVGLTWLLWRETQIPPGGILADDMGLGKTLSMISLILHKKNERLAAEKERKNTVHPQRNFFTSKNLIESHATLVIAPASLIYQWEKEVQDRVKDGLLRVCVFHGIKNRRISPSILARNDIVISTYQTVSSELSEKRLVVLNSAGSVDDDDDDDNDSDTKSPMLKKSKNRRAEKRVISKANTSSLSKIIWERIILDEAHHIKNRNSLVSRACCRLSALNRWCLTGTPIHNELWDLFSLIRFLRVTPFSEEKMWKDFVMNASTKNAERLNTLIKGLLLRRTKTQICNITKKPLVALKPRKYEVVTLNLKELERRCYDIMFAASKQKVRDLLKNQENDGYSLYTHRRKRETIRNPFLGGSRTVNLGNNRFESMSSVLVLLLRLRQACVHMCLTRNGIDLEAFQEAGGDVEDCGPVDVLEASFAHMSLDEEELLASIKDEEEDVDDEKESAMNGEEKRLRRKKRNAIEAIFKPEYESAKVTAVLEHLDRVIEAKDKCVVVSQWTSMLDIIEYHLKGKNVQLTSITGAVQTKDRQERVNSFNQCDGGAQVMLLSLTAGGVGLNLVGGNHLFLIDLHWNPALEQQACDRIYRMGQEKNVYIHKFLCGGTIEQRVLQLQEKKTALATSVLEGAASKKLNKLTMNDLKFLFELDKPRYALPQPAVQPSTSGGDAPIMLD